MKFAIFIALPQSDKKGAEKEYYQVHEFQTWDTRVLGEYPIGERTSEAEKNAILALSNSGATHKRG